MAFGSQRAKVSPEADLSPSILSELPIDLTADDDDVSDTSPSKNDDNATDLIKQWNARKDPLSKPASSSSSSPKTFGHPPNFAKAPQHNEGSRPRVNAALSTPTSAKDGSSGRNIPQRAAPSAIGGQTSGWGPLCTRRPISGEDAPSPAPSTAGPDSVTPHMRDAQVKTQTDSTASEASRAPMNPRNPTVNGNAATQQAYSGAVQSTRPPIRLPYASSCPLSHCSVGPFLTKTGYESHVSRHGQPDPGRSMSDKRSPTSREPVLQKTRQAPPAVTTSGTDTQPVNVQHFNGPNASTPMYNTTAASGLGFKRAADGQVKNGDTNAGLKLREYQPTTNGNIRKTVLNGTQQSIHSSNPSSAVQIASTPHTTSSAAPAPTQTTGDVTAKLVYAVSNQPRGGPFTAEENQLIIHLKETLKMPWPEIHEYFPNRPSWQSLQTHYSSKLKERPSKKLVWVDSPVDTTAEPASAGALRRSKRTAEPNRPQPRYVVPPLDDFMETQEVVKEVRQTRLPGRPSISGSLPTSREREAINNSDSVLATSEDEGPTAASNLHREITNRQAYASLPTRLEREKLRNECDRSTYAIASMTLRLRRAPMKRLLHAPGSHTQNQVRRQPSRSTKRAGAQINKPYLNQEQRHFVAKTVDEGHWDIHDTAKWNGEILHVDFTPLEVQLLGKSVSAVLPPTSGITSSFRGDAIQKIASHAVTHGPFLNRTQSSIEMYLQDTIHGYRNEPPASIRISLRKSNNCSMDRLLRWREKGQSGRRDYGDAMHTRMMETFGPTLRFRGTSGDVNTLAWAPDGTSFAVGSTALTDPNSMQYNRPNNLLLGDGHSSMLRELPHHASARQPGAGVNATTQMQASQDPLLFSTISSIQYFRDSNVMLTGGYDEAVRLWRIGKAPADVHCRYRIPCGGPVEGIAAGPAGKFAVAVRSTVGAIKLYRYEVNESYEQCSRLCKLSSPYARDSPEAGITPSCLRWGLGVQSERYLLGGFASRDDEQRRGEVCLWDVAHEQHVACTSLNKRSVFDITWSPSIFGRFAVGCSISDAKSVNRGTKSLVRIYDSRSLGAAYRSPVQMNTNQQATFELECPAWDMNDVIINPHDESLVSAGCTDGSVYMWDLRRPDSILHRLEHGKPLIELGDESNRESVDLGVRFISWDRYGRRLYTGSSDGVVAAWDPYRATEIAHEQDVVKMDSGVMAGAFSPDFSQLLLGDVQGSVLMLGIDEEDSTIGADFDFRRASEAEREDVAVRAGLSGSQVTTGGERIAGVTAAKELLGSGQIVIKPLGDFPKMQAVQGPRYCGPRDDKPGAEELRMKARRFQYDASLGEPRQQQQQQQQQQHQQDTRLNVFFEEDVVDNGAWKDRIPHQRHQSSASAFNETMHCLRCESNHLQAAPWLDDSGSGEDMIRCPDCETTWRADVLGYTVLENGRPRAQRNSVDLLMRDCSSASSSDRRAERGRGRGRRLKKSATTEYYADLWEVDNMVLLGGGRS